jgi:hypothetical protein
VIIMQGESDLLQVVRALGPACCLPGSLHRGQEQGDQHGEMAMTTRSSISVKPARWRDLMRVSYGYGMWEDDMRTSDGYNNTALNMRDAMIFWVFSIVNLVRVVRGLTPRHPFRGIPRILGGLSRRTGTQSPAPLTDSVRR